MARIKGWASGGAVGAVVFTLPVGYRPDSEVHIIVLGANAGNTVGQAVELTIKADGTVNLQAGVGNGWLSLDNIQFYAA